MTFEQCFDKMMNKASLLNPDLPLEMAQNYLMKYEIEADGLINRTRESSQSHLRMWKWGPFSIFTIFKQYVME